MKIKGFIEELKAQGLHDKYYDQYVCSSYPNTDYYEFMVYENNSLKVYTLAIAEYGDEYDEEYDEYRLYEDDDSLTMYDYILHCDLGWFNYWLEENENKFVTEDFVKEFLVENDGLVEIDRF